MNTLFRSFLFGILLIQSLNSHSQEYITDVESFTVENGLSQTTINTIFQDSRGFLWIGTQGGLNRYDGYNFKTYTPQVHKKYSISSSFITDIAEDSNGNLWIATRNGLNKFIVADDQFTVYRHDSDNPNTIASDEIQGVYIDNQGELWIKTPETVDRLDKSRNRFLHYRHYNNLFNFDNERIRYPMLEDKSGNFWIGTKDGLNLFDRKLMMFDRQIHNESIPGKWDSDIITSLILTRNNQMWAGTNNGLYVFDNETKKFTSPGFMKQLKGERISALMQDINGLIWIGSENGIYIYTPSNDELNKFRPENYNGDALNAQIVSLFQDKTGIIWIGTNRGLLKVNIRANKFRLISKNSKPAYNLTSDDIASIYKPDGNTLWIGTWGNGLNIIDLTRNTIRKFDFSRHDGNSNLNYVHSIFKDSKGNYWLGTRDGVLLFDPVSGQAKKICDAFGIKGCVLVKGNRISRITEDQDGNLWFTSYYGLLRLNKEKNEIVSWLNSPDDSTSMPSNINYSLKKGRNGLFWIGTDKGLVKFDPVSGRVLKKTPATNQELFSGTPVVYSLETDEKNNAIWGGSENGLIRFDLNCNITGLYTEDEHLSGNVIYSIFKDNYNNLWLSTNRGIVKFNIKNETVINYDLNDGIQNYEFNLGASFRDNDGSLYFGGISGVNIIRPDSVSKSSKVPNVMVTNIEIIDKSGVRQGVRTKNPTINLTYGTYLLNLDFAVLDFAFPLKNQFKYKFYSGEETDWIHLGNRHTATFTNLKPGRYVFKLIGSNGDMVWNLKGVEYEIIVESPFWLSTQAFYLYAIIAGLLFFAIYQFRTIQFHKTNKLLKQQELIAREMLLQKEELSVKNKNITDSINYAKRIQEALMPSEKQVKKIFKDSFVLLKPKDIVSGDFFWISERDERLFLAAIDCTGHGVPGAFMSIIGYEIFRKVTSNDNQIESSSEMLRQINQEFESIFKGVDNFTLRDGMDIAFVIIDKKSKKLEFSGAINPMYLIRDNKIMEIRGSRFSIGLEENEERSQSFESSSIDLEPDDIFYLFSDGYADQFGGPEGKKFKYRRFRHLLLTIHKFPMEEQLKLLEERFETWKGNNEQVDDILIIGIRPGL